MPPGLSSPATPWRWHRPWRSWKGPRTPTRSITRGAAHLCIVDPAPGRDGRRRKGSWPTSWRLTRRSASGSSGSRGWLISRLSGSQPAQYLRSKGPRIEGQRHHMIGPGRQRRSTLSRHQSHDQVIPFAIGLTNPPRAGAPRRAGPTRQHHERDADAARSGLDLGNGANPLNLEAGTAEQQRHDAGQVLVGDVHQRGAPVDGRGYSARPDSRSSIRTPRR